MEFYYVAYLLIQVGIDVPFEDGATFRYKEDAESYIKDRTERLTKKGFCIIRSKVSKRKVRKNYPTFGRETKKESLI